MTEREKRQARKEFFYTAEDTDEMLNPEEIKNEGIEGDYFAICANGKAYPATYVNDYFPGGTFFFCIPQGIEILGYIPA